MTDAPINRVTLEELEASIIDERYLNLGHGLASQGTLSDGHNAAGAPHVATERTTLCVLTLDNDIVVVGKSACVDPRLYDAKIGREIARRDAVNQVWPLLGMRLADKIANTKG